MHLHSAATWRTAGSPTQHSGGASGPHASRAVNGTKKAPSQATSTTTTTTKTPPTWPSSTSAACSPSPSFAASTKNSPTSTSPPSPGPYEQMTPTQRDQRTAFVIESTLAAYTSGKALYPRSTIARIESQLTAAGTALARRRKDFNPPPPAAQPLQTPSAAGLRHKLFSHCEAPQNRSCFPSRPTTTSPRTYPTWSPGAELAYSQRRLRLGLVPRQRTSLSSNDAPPALAMYVLAMVVCLRELVAELRGGTGSGQTAVMPIYMPAFEIVRRWNPAEREFLQSNGVEFVESNGEMFLKVDERTVVVSYRNWNPVKQVVADIAKPAALICTPVSDDPEQDFAWEDEQAGDTDDEETIRVPVVRSRLINPHSMVADPDSPRVRKLVEDYDAFELPELPGELPTETESKEAVKLYLRKPDASTKVEYW
ncbi:predicted protein [Chaetomium globosum CBS 148.51]|uniref:SRR1-like domain-containing protein n=1 Tax=Chaetomium globosum (strain ATCC 6205 / CBS 148.51 / DSM 1962 / NBRC 6347 / NRRL 1970) TaxID=306901 RepID=Q2HC21_CHAGB|nr:uncharacterized protein CHGG_02233 [Chaetomium globosum CBS 148.51]EAQ90298.1 predicted protein [Chaetomium globosum CBS 148.51]